MEPSRVWSPRECDKCGGYAADLYVYFYLYLYLYLYRRASQKGPGWQSTSTEGRAIRLPDIRYRREQGSSVDVDVEADVGVAGFW